MRIKELELENVGQLEHFQCEFRDGLIGLLGPQGSGKSTLVNTAFAGLTNDFSRFQGGKEGAIRQQRTPDRPSQFRLVVEHLTNSFEVTRILAPTVKSSLVLNGGTPITKAAEILSTLEDTLGADKQLLERYVFVEQWGLRKLFDQLDSERAKMFSHLCRTMHAELCWKALGERLDKDQKLVTTVAVDIDVLNAEIAACEQRVTDTEAQIGFAGNKIVHKEIYDAAVRIQTQFNAAEQLRKDLPGQEENEQKFLTTAKSANTAAKNAETARDLARSDLNTANTALQEAKQAKASYDTQKKAYDSWVQLKNRVGAIEKALAAPAPRMPDGPGLESLEDTRDDLLSRITPATAIINSLSQVEKAPFCPTCRQELKDVKEQLVHAKQLVATEKPRLTEIVAAIEKFTSFQKSAAVDIQRREQLNEELLEKTEQLTSSEDVQPPAGNAAILLTAAQSAQETADKAAKAADKAYDAAVLARANAISTHKNQKDLVAKTKTSIVACKHTAKDATDATNLLAIHRAGELELAGAKATLEAVQEQLAEKTTERANAAAIIAKSEKAKTWVAAMERSRAVLHRDRLPRIVHQSALHMLEDSVNETLELFQSPFYVRADDTLSYTGYFRNGTVMPAPGLSGGQQVVLSLAFRWALHSLFASQIGLLILDEPTAGLDSRHLDLLEGALLGLGTAAREKQCQVIIITHERGLDRVFDQTIQLERTID